MQSEPAIDAARQEPPLTLPCALVKIWPEGPAGDPIELPQAMSELLAGQPGIYRIESDLFAAAPVAGDPAVYDVTLSWCRRFVDDWRELAGGDEGGGLRAVIFPGVITLSGEGAELVPGPLVEDLRARRPRLDAGVYLTGRAVNMLEYPIELAGQSTYQGPSGSSVPLKRAGGPAYHAPPWRNIELFGRASQFATRARLLENLGELLSESITRVSGSLGSGKTRLVAERIAQKSGPRLWLRLRAARALGPTLGEQIIHQLLLPSPPQQADPLHPRFAPEVDLGKLRRLIERRAGRGSEEDASVFNDRALVALDRLAASGRQPIWLILDDFHQLARTDAAFFQELLRSDHLGTVFRLILIGRNGSPWPRELEPFPILDVTPLDEREMRVLGSRLTGGLSIPDAVLERFHQATGGFPFAFEEGLFSLIHEKNLRRIYGSFFFGGSEETEFQPSHRFMRHVEAEVARLGDAFPAHLLALVDSPAPAAEVAAAASMFGRRLEPGWELPLLEARILTAAESPWGRGVSIATGANRRALANAFAEVSATEIRHQLGQLLALRTSAGEGQWRAYRMLAGSEEAIEPLLASLGSSWSKQIPREELLEVLTAELAAHRLRGGAEAVELELLWRLLPLARRLGKLHKYTDDLARGVELGGSNPQRLLALASIKAEMDQEAGRYQEAEATIQGALKSAAASDDRRKAMLLIQLARLFVRQRRFDEARPLLENLEGALRRSGSSALAATCQFHLGNIALQQGRLEEAHEAHTAALAERRRQNLPRSAGSSLSALGTVASAAGNYPQALEYYREAEEILGEHGREGEVSFALLGLARTLGRIGDFTAASRPVRLALKLRQGRDDGAGESIARLEVAKNYLDLGQPETALEEARQAHFQLSMLSAEGPLADADQLLGRILLSQRQFEHARRRLGAAHEKHVAQGDRTDTAFDLAWLIETCIALEDSDGVRGFTAELKSLMVDLPSRDLGEVLEFRLFRGLDFLAAEGHKVGDPLSYLKRAYQAVLRKAAHLNHESRQQFLFQVPHNQDIVETATQRGLAGA